MELEHKACYICVCVSSPPGPAQTMYPPPTGHYGAPPQQQNYHINPVQSTPVHGKVPITNNTLSPNYYHNNQQQQQHLPQQHVANSSYTAPCSASSSQSYASLPFSAPPPSNTQYTQHSFQQRHPPYTTPASYYGQQSYQVPPPPLHHPTVLPAPSSGSETPLHPIVSYPSSQGISQYGTLSSLQGTSTPTIISNQMGAPLHQYNTSQPAPTTPVHPGYGGGLPSQMAPLMNGQGNPGLCHHA